ncbi:aminoglycoside phosphotransferase family protein [Chitinophaga arvensicola]|uniref:Streptomycin 6-kinase n=1 Tax=Chitinophaga arvensicola TaxID=29529 RepID=A0A1I0RQY7_9BACT|nr:aminoglycoside phosphotransferase family protein [Chitinophaga arvensicola]SEW43748.1 streptomycin 6-kinase [Chitinophaga arvensicola]
MAICNRDFTPEEQQLLQYYKQHWQLSDDGPAFVTHSSLLQPVLFNQAPAMLKIPLEAEEKLGYRLMVWWNGQGAAKVLRYDENALILEKVTSDITLLDMVKNGEDEQASRIICAVANQLHAPRGGLPPGLMPLEEWFRDLWPAVEKFGGILTESAALARVLLDNQHDQAVLHGDLHHENILHSDTRGWLAIDPKRLIGERAFDFANIFCNPDKATALSPGRLARQVTVISQAAQIDPTHLLKWVVAWAGLSAAWILNDGDDASLDLGVAETAFRQLHP